MIGTNTKTLSDYTIPCTKSQTKRALELGMPIEMDYGVIRHNMPTVVINQNYSSTHYFIPTAEQMVNWLEAQGEIHEIEISTVCDEYGQGWYYCVFDKDRCNISFNRNYSSRPQATLAAIDAALEYFLSNNKK